MVAAPARKNRVKQDRVVSSVEIGIHVFPSDLGFMAIAWRGDMLTALTFGHPSSSSAAAHLPPESRSAANRDIPALIQATIERLQRFAAGAADDFRDVAIDLGHLTEFQRSVVNACRRIKAGQARSYGELAAVAGSPRAARAVGNVMRGNRYPLIVPCHRVIGSDGKLCGFSCPEGLSDEGAAFDPRRRVEVEASLNSSASRRIPTMDFDERLQKAIERGHRRADARSEAQRQAEMTEEEFKRLHSLFRLRLSERIEECMKRLPNHFPGFRYETMYGDRGWGRACFRDDLRLDRGARATDYSRLEMTVRPYSHLHVLELSAKGTVRNKEVFTRNFFEPLAEVDLERFLGLVDTWVLEYAEVFATQ